MLADPSIGNIGNTGDMWRSENVRSFQQRRATIERLMIVHVERSAC
jgi:hypothetical protein